MFERFIFVWEINMKNVSVFPLCVNMYVSVCVCVCACACVCGCFMSACM